MSFKLVARAVDGGSDFVEFERSFNQPVVKIGRRDFNDVQLQDIRRLISASHAEIRQRERKFFLVDVASKNGTYLNGERLVLHREYALSAEDQIGIGDFILQFTLIHTEEPRPGFGERGTDSTTYLADVSQQTMALIEELENVYWENIDREPGERGSCLEETLQDRIARLDRGSAKRALELIEIRFPEPEYQKEKVLQGSPVETIECPSGEYEVYHAAYDGLLKIVGRFIENLRGISSRGDIEKLIERIDQSMSVMMKCLADAIKGRRQFEQELDVEATRIFSWKPNPIKLAEQDREIGKYLFDWRRPDAPVDKVVADLRDAFTDLALHQMGMIAGFKECLRGLLSQLDPESLEAESRAKSVQWGPLKIPLPLPLQISTGAWSRYKEKHRELVEEEVKTFETVLGPYFAKGYLSVQRKRAS